MKKEFLQETNFAEEYEDSGPATEEQKKRLEKYQQWAQADDDKLTSAGQGF